MPGTAREWYGKRGVAYPMTCAISTVKRGRPEPSASVRASGVYKAGTPLAVTTKFERSGQDDDADHARPLHP